MNKFALIKENLPLTLQCRALCMIYPPLQTAPIFQHVILWPFQHKRRATQLAVYLIFIISPKEIMLVV